MAEENKTLIEELGLGDPNDSRNKELMAQLADTLQNRVITRLMEVLSEEDKQNLDKYIAENNAELLNEYLIENVPGLDLIAQSEYEKLRQELLSQNEEIKKIIEENK